MKKPVVRSRSGRIWRQRRIVGRGERRREGAEVLDRERRRLPSAAARAAPRPDPRSRGGRSCRSRRRASRPAAAPRPRGPGSGPGPRPAARSPRSVLRQRASGREASAPRSEQGASTRTRSKSGRHAARRGVGLDHRDVAEPEPLGLGRDLGRALGSSSTDIVSPRSPIRAAIWPVLMPGPGAEVEDVLAGLRVEHLDDGRRAAALRGQLAGSDRACVPSPILPVEDEHLRRRQRPLARPAGATPSASSGRSKERRGASIQICSCAASEARLSGRPRPARCRRRAASARRRARAPPTTSAPARAAPSGRRRRARGWSRRSRSSAVSSPARAPPGAAPR